MSQFELEVKQVLSLRDQGLNIRKISNLLNKTQSWVYARMNLKYAPRGKSAEKLFQEEIVIPELECEGHTIIERQAKIGQPPFQQVCDILSTTNNADGSQNLWISEIKVTFEGHELQRGIGQLLLHRLASPQANLQLIGPWDAFNARTQHEALKPFLLNHVGIHLFLIDIDHMRFLDAQAFKEEDEKRRRDQSDNA